MPGFVVRAGLANAVLPLPHIAAELRRRLSLTDLGPLEVPNAR
jgi:hypothetical protein